MVDRKIEVVSIRHLITKIKLDAWPYVYPLAGQPADFPELQPDSPILLELFNKREVLIRFQYLFCTELSEILEEISEDREYSLEEIEYQQKRIDNCEYRKPFMDALSDMKRALDPLREKYQPAADALYKQYKREKGSQA
jgi:hypothetical protein